jgi:K+-sensing histidine kinase KdpD
VSRRNRVLESLRFMLESLAGPDRVEGGIGASLLALSGALGAQTVAIFVAREDAVELYARNENVPLDPAAAVRLHAAAATALSNGRDGRVRLVDRDVAAVPLRHPEGPAVVVAQLANGTGPATTADTLELLDDATRSLALAMEGEQLERTRREATALRRSQVIQRDLLSSLSHELRTPLTAIQGYASTLRQTDLTWDEASTHAFLGSIATEAARLERLVGDLLDSTAIESGILRLQRDWCDLRLVLEAAVRLVGDATPVTLDVDGETEPIWADHDRLEQVFVNLLENASTHGASPSGIDVTLRVGAPGTVEVEVRDHGPGVPRSLGDRIFEPRVRGATDVAGAGLGLPIARAIVEAHGGELVTRRVDAGAAFVVVLPPEPPAGVVDRLDDGSWTVFDVV